MNPWVLGGGAAIILVMGFLLKHNYTEIGELQAKLDTQAEQTRECADANQSNQGTIDELMGKIDSLSTLRASEAAERERVLAERDEQLTLARARADRLERERQDEVLDNEQCRDLRTLRVDKFCPATAGQLRDRSRGTGGDQDGDQGGPG